MYEVSYWEDDGGRVSKPLLMSDLRPSVVNTRMREKSVGMCSREPTLSKSALMSPITKRNASIQKKVKRLWGIPSTYGGYNTI